MFLSKALYPLLSTGSTQEERKSSEHEGKIVDCDVKHQRKASRVCKLTRALIYEINQFSL